MSGIARTIPLKQATGPHPGKPDPGKPRLARSRVGKWRALVLILVYGAMIAHFVHWRVAGRTVSPVEPSESMQTLEQGLVNAGAIFFGVALLSTLIFGRFFCGWGCHIIALQDLCSWMMEKVGIRPKPFRSRLLLWIPLGLAIYMFVWPTLTRVALVPLFENAGWAWPVFMAQPQAITTYQSELLVEDYWATFPEWYVAIPFLFVCGFVIVYFMGAKGYCTYACPYGGFFAPLDKLAPVRIRVTDACEHCGHCTAACGSNVRVHEEVRDFGMVMDPGCMKCLDCVSVCPNDALYVGLGRPAILAPKPTDAQKQTRAESKAKRGRRLDLGWGEEIVLAIVWLGLFLSLRGLFDQVPMLMAAGLAGIGAYLLWKAWSLVLKKDVRTHGLVFKAKGRLRPWGVTLVLCAVGLVVVSGWSGAVRATRFAGMASRNAIAIPADALLRPEFEAGAEARRQADAGLKRLLRAERPERGGFGWGLPPDRLVDVAYLQAVRRDYAGASATLERLVDVGHPTDALVAQIGQLHGLLGIDPDKTIGVYERAVKNHPELYAIRGELARVYATRQEPERADAVWDGADETPDGKIEHARYLLWKNQTQTGIDLIESAADELIADAHAPTGALTAVAGLGANLGRTGLMQRVADRLKDQPWWDTDASIVRTQLLAQLGKPQDEIVQALDPIVENTGKLRAGALTQAGRLLILLGKTEQGEALLTEAFTKLEGDIWSLAGLASLYVELSGATNNQAYLDQGVAMMESVVSLDPASPLLRHDLASLYARMNRFQEAADSMAKAVELSSENPVLAERASQLAQIAGRPDASKGFSTEAIRRAKPDSADD